jgi:hypothetical protein
MAEQEMEDDDSCSLALVKQPLLSSFRKKETLQSNAGTFRNGVVLL